MGHHERRSAGPSPSHAEEHRSSDLSALVVDDEPETCELVSRALRAAGFDVLVAPDGQSALAWCDRSPPAVLLVGENVLVPSQVDRLDRLRARRNGRAPRVIVVMTGGVDAAVPCVHPEADDLVTKPLDVPDLVARVCAQVHRSSTPASQGAARPHVDAVSLLRRLSHGGDIETVARAVCHELMSDAGIEAAGIVAFRGTRAAVSVAGTGAWNGWREPGEMLSPGIARVLRAAVADGPRINRASTRRARDLRVVGMREATGTLDVALAPIRGRAGTLGVLAVAASPIDGQPTDHSILATAIDVAAVLQALVGSELEVEAQIEASRTEIVDRIDRGAFTPVYQPIVDLASGAVVGLEGLTRWHDRAAPELRFGEAHELGLGIELECAAIARIIRDAPPRPDGVWLSFNASPVTVLSGALDDLLTDAPAGLVLELTEHDEITDYGALRTALARSGVVVAVDDAGGGYASMRHVLDLRPSIVKLDINWVHEIDHDLARQSLTVAMVQFAATMGIHVVAEGIETPGERRTLLALGVTTGQGHLYAHPTPGGGVALGDAARVVC